MKILLKYILIFLGILSLGLGILGIFIPGLPTTPFLLLAAILFVRSSSRLYEWLVNNRYLGKYIRNYRKQRGMSRRQKIYALALMWVMILLSVFVFLQSFTIKIIVIVVGLIGTFVMGFVVRTAKSDADNTDRTDNRR